MSEASRKRLIYVIGGLAFAIAIVTLAFSVIEFIKVFKEAGSSLKAIALDQYDMLIEIVFAVMELTLGFRLIKQWKAGETFEIHKTVSQLIGAVVYSSFVGILYTEIVGSILSGGITELKVSTVYLIVYLVYGVFMMSIPSLVKKRKLMQLCWSMLFTAIIGIGFGVYSAILSVVHASGLAAVGTDVANTLLMILVVIFYIGTVAFYAKNPVDLDHDVRENEDSEVIKTTKTHEVVRIYLTRGTDDKVNVLISVMTLASVVFGVVGIAFYLVESGVAQYFKGNLGDIIGTFQSIMTGSESSMHLLMSLMFLFVYALVYLSVGISVFTKRGDAKVGILTIASVGTFMAVFSSISLIIDVVMDVTLTHSFKLSDYSVFQIILLALYLIYSLTRKVYAKLTTEINDGIVKRGDPYHTHAKSIARIVLFSGLYSVAAMILFFIMRLQEGAISIAHLAFLVSTVLIILATQLEVKHPFSEYIKVRRRLRPAVEQGVLPESEAVAIGAEDTADGAQAPSQTACESAECREQDLPLAQPPLVESASVLDEVAATAEATDEAWEQKEQDVLEEGFVLENDDEEDPRDTTD